MSFCKGARLPVPSVTPLQGLGDQGVEPAAFPIIHPSFCFPLGERESLPERTRVVPGLSGEVALFPLQVQSFTPENLLFVSTPDGSLHALSKQTGDLKWTLKDGKERLSLLTPWTSSWGRSPQDKSMGSRIQNSGVFSQLYHLPRLCGLGKVTSPL